MDVSGIDFNYLELFDLAYTIAQGIFDTEPATASLKTKKRIRRWVLKTYCDDASFPRQVEAYIRKDVSDEAFIDFLKACHDHVQTHGTHQKQLFDRSAAELPKDVKAALWSLFETGSYFTIRPEGENAVISVDFGSCYERTLTLKNVACLPDGDAMISFENGSLVRQEGLYVLVGIQESWEEEMETPVAVRFTDASVKVTLSRADQDLFSDTPWLHLTATASAILDKCFLPGDYLNDREKALLPLLAQLSRLSYFARIPEQFRDDGFAELKQYFKKHDCPKPLALLEKLEALPADSAKADRLTVKLLAMLNQKAYEPLWRELSRLISDSQADYPSLVGIKCASELLEKTRLDIQRHMEENGYSGTYPDFVKLGSVDRIHLAQSYGMNYFVCWEKRVACHVHCTDAFFNDHLVVEFLCGTQILRKDETPGDIASCLFHSGGRSFFQSFTYGGGFRDETEETNADHLAALVRIATKKAELKPLSKQEHDELDDLHISWWRLFLSVFVIMGGLFGLFMTMGIAVVCALMILLFDGPGRPLEVLAAVPWWLVFVFAWVAFGSCMGIITVLAQRK